MRTGRGATSSHLRVAAKRRVAALAAVLAAACSSSSADAPRVERSDSAGIAIVRNPGGDRALDWGFTEVLRLGGKDEGSEAFYELNPYVVEVDGTGRIYVLDAPRDQVQVFGPAGEHLRTLGGRGLGPGELESPSTLDVSAGGRVAVRDFAKPALVEWAPDGEVVATEPLTIPLYSPFALTEGGLVATFTRPHQGDGLYWERLAVMTPGDTTIIVETARADAKMVDFGCVGLNIAPRFAPQLVWDSEAGRTTATAEAIYDFHLVEADGQRLRIRREIPPREVTRAMALQDLGEGMQIRFEGRDPCIIPPETALERQGYLPVLPAIEAIRLSPDGTIWVRRGSIEGEPFVIDLFAADGAYLGTLPGGSPFPVTFMPDGGPVAVESDEMDVDRVVVYRIER